MTMITARALLLDMDGTLVDSGAVVQRVWSDWSRRYGIDPARTIAIAHGRQGHEVMRELLPARPDEHNIAENAELLAIETETLDGIVAIGGAVDFMTAIVDLPHALVTSADVALATARMGAAGVRMPEIRVTAEDVTASKPDPEGFVAAARMLGVDPADCVVFEDSTAGVAAGFAAGMRVLGVGAHAAAAGATWTVPDLRGLVVTAADGGVTITMPE